MFSETFDRETLFTMFHLLGVVLGAGGAFASDAMFLSSIKDRKFSKTEIRFLKLGSAMVWTGLVILIASGTLLFLGDPAGYLASSKFLAKMTIVAVIVANGLIFHLTHIPRIVRHVGEDLSSSDEFARKGGLLFLSGVISMVSWVSALSLGALRSVPYSYAEIVGAYISVMAAGIIIGLFMKRKLIPPHRVR